MLKNILNLILSLSVIVNTSISYAGAINITNYECNGLSGENKLLKLQPFITFLKKNILVNEKIVYVINSIDGVIEIELACGSNGAVNPKYGKLYLIQSMLELQRIIINVSPNNFPNIISDPTMKNEIINGIAFELFNLKSFTQLKTQNKLPPKTLHFSDKNKFADSAMQYEYNIFKTDLIPTFKEGVTNNNWSKAYLKDLKNAEKNWFSISKHRQKYLDSYEQESLEIKNTLEKVKTTFESINKQIQELSQNATNNQEKFSQLMAITKNLYKHVKVWEDTCDQTLFIEKIEPLFKECKEKINIYAKQLSKK